MYYDFIQTHKRKILISIAAFLAYIVIWSTWLTIDHAGKVPLVIAVVPSDATVVIDNTRTGGGTHWLKDGPHSVVVQKEGFATSSTNVTVSSQKSQNVIAVSLNPETDEAKKWAAGHQRDYAKNEQYGAIAANADGKYFTAKNPITKELPYNDPYFTIGYTPGKNDTVILTVTTPSPRYRFYAVQKIRDLGYDPTDFKIVFKDFHNPLESKK